MDNNHISERICNFFEKDALYLIKGTEFYRIRIADIEELKRLSSEVYKIYVDVEKNCSMHRLFLKDFIDFTRFLESIDNAKSMKSLKNQEDMNRNFIHLLSSGKLFVDFNESTVKRKYGKDAYNEVHKYSSYQFDNFFEYRFFCKLRNYSHHIGLPITKVRLTEDNNSDKLFFEINILLNANFDWGEKLKKDFKKKLSANHDIGVKSLIEGYFRSINHLFLKYNQFFLQKNNDKLQELQKSFEKLGIGEGYYGLQVGDQNFTLSEIYSTNKIKEIYYKLNIT